MRRETFLQGEVTDRVIHKNLCISFSDSGLPKIRKNFCPYKPLIYSLTDLVKLFFENLLAYYSQTIHGSFSCTPPFRKKKKSKKKIITVEF